MTDLRIAWKFLKGAALAAAALWLVAVLFKVHRLSEWRRELVDAGFPKDYATSLAVLKFDHPQWCFEPLAVSDLDWNDIVDRECSAGWNLVAGSRWAPSKWRKYGADNYTPYYAVNAKAYDSGTWYQASREAIAYFLDPRNFLNSKDIFMFETLGFNRDSQTAGIVERVLSQTFMANAAYDGGERRYSQLLLEVGERYGVSPVFLASRLASEQGQGSVQARGRIGDSLVELSTNSSGRVGGLSVWGGNFAYGASNTQAIVAMGADAYNGYYNFFNIGACGSGIFEIRYNAWRESVSKEVVANYLGPWTTQALAIEGGAKKIAERYLSNFRHTRYLQKFSVAAEAGAYRWKQYMQNIAAPLVESRLSAAAYDANGDLDAPFRFIIPVYRRMPDSPCADPAGGKSVYSPTR